MDAEAGVTGAADVAGAVGVAAAGAAAGDGVEDVGVVEDGAGVAVGDAKAEDAGHGLDGESQNLDARVAWAAHCHCH